MLGEVLGEELGQGEDMEWIVVAVEVKDEDVREEEVAVEVKDEDVREEVVAVVVTVTERTLLIPSLFWSQKLGMIQTTMFLAPANFCL